MAIYLTGACLTDGGQAGIHTLHTLHALQGESIETLRTSLDSGLHVCAAGNNRQTTTHLLEKEQSIGVNLKKKD